jgi:4-diphosphocytidyl-2-C-methyl-D-erythritol kinase
MNLMFTLFAPAKINLALDILYKRPDGYHEIDSIMQTIALADQLTFEAYHQLELTCSDSRLPTDQNNLAWKAAELLQQETGITQGVKIHITKNIPIAAGLAGGSTDAASVLIALNQLWSLGFSTDELMKIGIKLGADVPFCIRRGTARAGGIGEKLTDIHSKIKSTLLLVTPNITVSTAAAYDRFQITPILQHPQVSQVVAALESGDFQQLNLSWGNVFEELIAVDFPAVRQVKEIFRQFGLTANLMSGSGPSVFALNPPPDMIKPLLAAIPREWFCCLTEFL